ncbi:hypothetical protein SAY87_024725 [Trapa incisa]|uniref:TF-B3 domain-containing protein n=1 Tax=Trapa incisa TaxID=236973 RepID=A0AAN7GLA4_9MYRT|nr:hypothetical protein SAY87_024725 [Trapa incisa]
MPRPYFYKLVLLSTTKEKRLRIPEKFLRKLHEELSPVATLHISDGNIWRVGIRKAHNKFWFYDGWQEFADHYSISIGYFLIFRYEGTSIFNVYIFNLKTSEINYQSPIRGLARGEQHIQVARYTLWNDMEDDDSSDALDHTPEYRVTTDLLKKKSVKGSSSVDQLTLSQNFTVTVPRSFLNGNVLYSGGMKLKSTEDEMKVQTHAEVHKPKKTSRKKRKIEASEPMSSTQPGEESEMKFRLYASASTRKRPVTAEDRERAINAAKMFEPRNPFCRVVLRPSYLYRGCIMYLPSCFAEKHLNGVSGFVRLQRSDGKQWCVKCMYRGGGAKLSRGWYDFSLENNLQEGDVCVFELIAAREIILKVTTFRVVDNAMMLNRHFR